MTAALTELDYAPIIKGKTGELSAIHDLAEHPASYHLVPIVEVPPPSDQQERNQSIEEFFAAVATRISENLGPRRFFVDFRLVAERLSESALRAFVEGLGESDPFYVLSSALPRDAHALVLQHVSSGGALAVRVRDADFSEAAESIEERVSHLEQVGPVGRDRMTMILDLGTVVSDDAERDARAVRSLALDLPDLDRFDSFVLASGAYPQPVPAKSGDRARYPRADWGLYTRVRESLPRVPTFSDYGVTGRELPQLNKPRVAPKLVYTTDDSWYLGKESKQRGEETFGRVRVIAKDILALEEYRGKEFSPGDLRIWELANKEWTENDTTGNPTDWIRAAFSHHAAVVLEQLRSL